MKRKGFTLIELMIVVAIIAILASIAIPQYKKFQLKAKTSEAKSNIGAIRSAEETYAAENDAYMQAGWAPSDVPGAAPDPWGGDTSGFNKIGFRPAGNVYYRYGVAQGSSWTDPSDGTQVTATASTDIIIMAEGDLDEDDDHGAFYATDEDPKVTDSNPGEF